MAFIHALSCPIIRPATADDAKDIVNVILNSKSELIGSVFENNLRGAEAILLDQYKKHYAGVYVLTEADSIVAVMKIHLPGEQVGKTISLSKLIRELGIRKGIRAVFLLSNWDEYKCSSGEAYIEYLNVHKDFRGMNCEQLLIDRAAELGREHGSSYLSIFTPLRDYKNQEILKNIGFIPRRKIHSPIAKIYGVNSAWRKYTFTLIDGPITVKEYVNAKVDVVRQRIRMEKNKETIAAFRVSLILTLIPIVAGLFAYFRGYIIAAIGWLILMIFHLLGAYKFLSNPKLGKYMIAIAMISESFNLFFRALNTNKWFDRGWLLPLSLINFWIFYNLIFTNANLDIKHGRKEILH